MQTEVVKKTALLYRKEDPNAWYNEELEELPNNLPPITVEQIEALYVLASKIQQELPKKRDQFEDKMLESGTVSDKIALLTVILKRDVVSNVPLFDQILQLCDSKSNRISELAINSLKDLFVNSILPHRELIHFKDRPLATVQKAVKEVSKSKKTPYERHLLWWYVEDVIKAKYRAFCHILEAKAHNMLDVVKDKVIKAARSLIAVSKENRYPLLKILIRKFTDKNGKMAGMALFFLLHLTNPSPGNPYYCKDLDKKVLIQEISNFVNDPEHSIQSKVYAARYLQFMELNPETDRPIAKQLITTYINLCKFYSKQKQLDITLIEAVLAGIRRAIIFANLNPEEYMNDLQTLFRIAHMSHFNVAVEAIRVIWQIIEAANHETLTRAYYTLLYHKIMDPDLKTSSKISIFLNLLLRSVRGDRNANRCKAIVKRLLQSCFMNGAPYTCSVLLIVRQMMMSKPAIRTLLTQSDEFVKRLDDDEDEERYFDILDKKEDEDDESIHFKGDFDAQLTPSEKKIEPKSEMFYYNPRERVPENSGAEKSALWELSLLLTYFHPSAQKFVQAIMKNSKVLNYDGNPLEDYSLTNFLDKFNFKKPKPQKASKFTRGVEALKFTRPPLNSPAILEVPSNLVREDEKFYVTYMKDKKQNHEIITKKIEERKQTLLKHKKAENDEMMKTIQEQIELPEEKEEWDYDDLDKVIAQDTLDDSDLDELLMEYGSDGNSEDEEEEESSKKNKKKKAKSFGYDVESGHIDDVSRANQDEFQELLEPESEEDQLSADEEQTDGKKRKNRWSANKKMKRVKVEKKQKPKKEKK